MAEKIKAEGSGGLLAPDGAGTGDAASARREWRRAQGRRTIRELQGDRHRAPLLWMVIPFLTGAALERLGGACPFEHPAAVGALFSILAIFASFGRSPLAHAVWAATHCAAMAIAGLLVLAGRTPAGHRHVPPAYETLRVRVTRMGAPHAAAFRSRSAQAGSVPHTTRAATGFGAVVPTGEPVAFSLPVQPGETLPIRGEEVVLSGWSKPVPAWGGADSYNGYLRGLGIRRQIESARIRSVSRPPSWYARQREALAARMTVLLAMGFGGHPELAAIYRAMMLGKKDGLTAAQKRLFVRSGTMHLFAINGLHIGIVAVSAHALLSLLRVRGRAAAVLVLAVLWIDVDSTGAAPSAVRAFLMVGLLEIGRAAWLPMNSLAAVTGAAALMLALDPTAAFGASFQMSFGVVAALILLGVPLAAHLRERWNPYPLLPPSTRTLWQRLRAAATEHVATAAGFSAAAALVSAITGVTYFAAWSPAGIPANLLLMPLATLVIIAGFSAIVAGLAHATALTALFNAAACLLLRAITSALARIVAFPCASFTAHLRAPWIGPAALAALLALCLRGYAVEWDEQRGGWWPPFLATAAMMIFGVNYG